MFVQKEKRKEVTTYVVTERYDEKEVGEYAFAGKDKLWLQKSHYYDDGIRTGFHNSHRCVIFKYAVLYKQCYCSRPGGKEL